ncbi:DUF6538 domain-containing protein [Defluviimonas sp. SAOS-178_SWC]|uniref:DUF6538 domain-containing protein n=1 Tax=Defluviimonas sp. SAOS-178_SWC TaxID=3121287 RepID=UPI003D80AF79
MGVTIRESGAYLLNAKYLELRDNTWYIRRRIPADIRGYYPNKPLQIFVSLRRCCPNPGLCAVSLSPDGPILRAL